MNELTLEFGMDGNKVCVSILGDNREGPEKAYGFGETKKEAVQDLLQWLNDDLQ